jgi:hypothetical protein
MRCRRSPRSSAARVFSEEYSEVGGGGADRGISARQHGGDRRDRRREGRALPAETDVAQQATDAPAPRSKSASVATARRRPHTAPTER